MLLSFILESHPNTDALFQLVKGQIIEELQPMLAGDRRTTLNTGYIHRQQPNHGRTNKCTDFNTTKRTQLLYRMADSTNNIKKYF